MLVCYECGKRVKGEVIHHIPTILAEKLGDFRKAFHPKCHGKAEERAEKELKGGTVGMIYRNPILP